ncbi:ergothioneine biosynthesis protein EgtB [Candidatus Protofrankia californiensis]|uniref:ergothioneine biosynthesis protein EgtB n=1 Tax=Candidatus Protofrankia californiensis TaxID=1839754 RepID=UPI001F494306|nr:ergothioneine biosynthesis protein EgtB [Candidatus Protofrankia californiensis]
MTTQLTTDEIVRALADSRARSLAYTDLDDTDLWRQHSPLMSPLVWDLAHIGNYEESWLLRAVAGRQPLRPGIGDLYDAFRHPRADRPALPLLGPAQARSYVSEVRGRVLDVLERLDPDTLLSLSTQLVSDSRPSPRMTDMVGTPGPRSRAALLAGGFVYGLVVQHEHQHDETMLATHQLRTGSPIIGDRAVPPPGRPVPAAEILIPAGEFTMGTSGDTAGTAWAYDNERPAHRVYVPAFFIDTLPVSNAAHAAFIEAGGYHDERLWSASGWAWRCRADLTAPQFWRRDGSTWIRRRFGRDEPVPMDEPVQHVCWYEAQAHARWAGRRLPTEAEWEKACAHDPVTGSSRRFPWGDSEPTSARANLGQAASRPAPLGAYPAGASAYGVEQMIGDVWEWTAGDFMGYPGFKSFPYREYSEVFFSRVTGAASGVSSDPAPAPGRTSSAETIGSAESAEAAEFAGFKVLRGGSWATHHSAVRATFRNWDHAIRRQIFAGFRLARDA